MLSKNTNDNGFHGLRGNSISDMPLLSADSFKLSGDNLLKPNCWNCCKDNTKEKKQALEFYILAGDKYYEDKLFLQAIDCYKKVIILARKLKYYNEEANCLIQIAFILLQNLNDYDESFYFVQNSRLAFINSRSFHVYFSKLINIVDLYLGSNDPRMFALDTLKLAFDDIVKYMNSKNDISIEIIVKILQKLEKYLIRNEMYEELIIKCEQISKEFFKNTNTKFEALISQGLITLLFLVIKYNKLNNPLQEQNTIDFLQQKIQGLDAFLVESQPSSDRISINIKALIDSFYENKKVKFINSKKNLESIYTNGILERINKLFSDKYKNRTIKSKDQELSFSVRDSNNSLLNVNTLSKNFPISNDGSSPIRPSNEYERYDRYRQTAAEDDLNILETHDNLMSSGNIRQSKPGRQLHFGQNDIFESDEEFDELEDENLDEGQDEVEEDKFEEENLESSVKGNNHFTQAILNEEQNLLNSSKLVSNLDKANESLDSKTINYSSIKSLPNLNNSTTQSDKNKDNAITNGNKRNLVINTELTTPDIRTNNNFNMKSDQMSTHFNSENHSPKIISPSTKRLARLGSSRPLPSPPKESTFSRMKSTKLFHENILQLYTNDNIDSNDLNLEQMLAPVKRNNDYYDYGKKTKLNKNKAETNLTEGSQNRDIDKIANKIVINTKDGVVIEKVEKPKDEDDDYFDNLHVPKSQSLLKNQKYENNFNTITEEDASINQENNNTNRNNKDAKDVLNETNPVFYSMDEILDTSVTPTPNPNENEAPQSSTITNTNTTVPKNELLKNKIAYFVNKRIVNDKIISFISTNKINDNKTPDNELDHITNSNDNNNLYNNQVNNIQDSFNDEIYSVALSVINMSNMADLKDSEKVMGLVIPNNNNFANEDTKEINHNDNHSNYESVVSPKSNLNYNKEKEIVLSNNEIININNMNQDTNRNPVVPSREGSSDLFNKERTERTSSKNKSATKSADNLVNFKFSKVISERDSKYIDLSGTDNNNGGSIRQFHSELNLNNILKDSARSSKDLSSYSRRKDSDEDDAVYIPPANKNNKGSQKQNAYNDHEDNDSEDNDAKDQKQHSSFNSEKNSASEWGNSKILEVTEDKLDESLNGSKKPYVEYEQEHSLVSVSQHDKSFDNNRNIQKQKFSNKVNLIEEDKFNQHDDDLKFDMISISMDDNFESSSVKGNKMNQ